MNYFPWMDQNFRDEVVSLYESAIDEHGSQYAYDTMVSDLQVTCGNLEIATKAAKGRSVDAKTYLVHNEMFATEGNVPAGQFAFHAWDLMLVRMDNERGEYLRKVWVEVG